MRTQIVRPIIHNGRTNLTPGDAAWPDFIREALHEFLESLDEKTALLALTIRMRSAQQLDAVRLLLHEGHTVYGISLGPNEERYDIGNFGAYFRAFVEFALADDRQGAELRRYLEELLRGDHP